MSSSASQGLLRGLLISLKNLVDATEATTHRSSVTKPYGLTRRVLLQLFWVIVGFKALKTTYRDQVGSKILLQGTNIPDRMYGLYS
jgi:hypothetical protein